MTEVGVEVSPLSSECRNLWLPWTSELVLHPPSPLPLPFHQIAQHKTPTVVLKGLTEHSLSPYAYQRGSGPVDHTFYKKYTPKP
jgi:hypothetical protein